MLLDAWSPKKALNKNIIYIDSLMKYENYMNEEKCASFYRFLYETGARTLQSSVSPSATTKTHLQTTKTLELAWLKTAA